MNEFELREKWESEQPIFEAWGKHVLDTITNELKEKGKDLKQFLKIPAEYRLKDDESLIDKAFYRSKEKYSDPYSEIEDKVGVRFVVLLIEDIKEICNIIENCSVWKFDQCKHFESDREKCPLFFTYQSVHYILSPKEAFTADNITIPASTTCEIQIRTLLQHAHAELTHDAIYKAKRKVKPDVHRTVAKSMALIETTDDFFNEVNEKLVYGPLKDHHIIQKLDNLYHDLTNQKPCLQKTAMIIFDEFERFVDGELIDNIKQFIDKNDGLKMAINIAINKSYNENMIYRQSVILFIYWMLYCKRNQFLPDWPFEVNLLEKLAGDLGISLERYYDS